MEPRIATAPEAAVTSSPRVATVPSRLLEGDARVFDDAMEKGRLLVDARHGRVRRTGLPERPRRTPADRRPARPAAFELGPDARMLEAIGARWPDRHLEPMAWDGGAFSAWIRHPAGATVIAHGTVGARRPQVAEIHGLLPPGVEMAESIVAVERRHRARLRGATVLGGDGAGHGGEAVVSTARLGRRAAWRASLAAALETALDRALDAGSLRLEVDAGRLPLRAFHEMRDWAVGEWCRRLAGSTPLSTPASRVGAGDLRSDADLEIAWGDGDLITLSTVCTTRFDSVAIDPIGMPSAWARPASAARPIAPAGELG